MRLFAIRGATSVERNDAESILTATEELVREVMARNDLSADDMVSCIFTATDDLDAEFPAVAARRLGLDSVPLLCSREIPVPGALPRVIRLLLHYHAGEDRLGVVALDARGAPYGEQPHGGREAIQWR